MAEELPVRGTITKVIVIGGCYGGLSAALSLLDLCRSQSRATAYLPDNGCDRPKIPIEIKIIDERDGYCKCLSPVVSKPD